jgi:hypothetical protein
MLMSAQLRRNLDILVAQDAAITTIETLEDF